MNDERSVLLLEISNYAFAEACKEAKHKADDGSNTTPKMTIEDLDVCIKIASTKTWKTKSDQSSNLGSNKRNIIYETLTSPTKMNPNQFQDLAFDSWGLKMKLVAFCRMLTRNFMTELLNDCYKVLKCKGITPPSFGEPQPIAEQLEDQSSSAAEDGKIQKKKKKSQNQHQKKKKIELAKFVLPK